MRRMRHIKAREFQGCDVAYDFSVPSSLYDATTGGSLVAADGAIARCEDVSGNGHHLTQSSGGSQPARKVGQLNGVDAGRFDGTADWMTAGDAGDMLGNSLTLVAVFQRTGAAAAVMGIAGKTKAAAGNGRYGISGTTTTYNAYAIVGATPSANISTSTDLAILASRVDRVAGANQSSVTHCRNAVQEAVAPYTDGLASYNTAEHFMVGCFADSSGTAPLSGSYLGGDYGEVIKYSVALGIAQQRRLEHSRMRKWRISG